MPITPLAPVLRERMTAFLPSSGATGYWPISAIPARTKTMPSGDDDRPGLGQSLKAGREVRRLPDHSVLPQRTLTDHHHAGRDADAYRERFRGTVRAGLDIMAAVARLNARHGLAQE